MPSAENIKVLLVEDVESDAELVKRELRRAKIDFESRRVQTEADLRRDLREFQPDIVLSDFAMPGFNGLAALKICKEWSADTPFIFMSGTVGEEIAVEAMKAGANDYVMKDSLARLAPAVARELREAAKRSRDQADLQRFRLALDNSADIIVIIDRATMRHVDVNLTACSLLGYTRDELLRMGPADLLPVSREELEKTYDALIADPSRVSGMNSYYRCKDGSHLPFEATRRVLRSGDTWLIAAISRDIRDRIAAEQALSESEAYLRRLNRVYAVLSGINTLIVRMQDRDELFHEACRVAVKDGQFRMAWIGVVDHEIQRVKPVASDGEVRGFFDSSPLTAEDSKRKAGKGMAWTAVQERRPVISNDIQSDPQTAMKQECKERGINSLMMLPLIVAGEGVGVLALYAAETGFFDDEEMKLLNDLAGNVSFAMEHIDKEEKLNRLKRVNAVLSSVNAAIVRIRDRQELFRESCRIAVEAGQLRLAWIGIVDPRAEQIVPAALSGPAQGFLGIIRLSTRQDSGQFGMAGRAVRDRAPVVSNDVLADERAARRQESAQRGFRSVAMIPLLVDQSVVGVLGLHAAETGFFDHDEMKLVREIAGNIAFALDHIDKEEKVRRLTRVHAVLSGINGAIVRVRDREELFREACRVAVEAGQFPLAWVAAVDREGQQVKAVAWAGDEGGFLQLVRPTVGATGATGATGAPRGKPGLSAQAVETRMAAICNDIEADGSAMRYAKEALERGYRSAVALPLQVGGAAIGSLVLYAAETGFFDDQEMKLLNNLAGDISFALDHLEKANRLDYLAYHDALTGLLNRNYFYERVGQLVEAAAAHSGTKLAVLIFDIDRFRTINDSLGRGAGDELLRQVAQRMKQAAADPGSLARIGADRFAVVRPDVSSESEVARHNEQKMEEIFAAPFRVGETDLRIAVKVGIAIYPADGADADTLFRNAEAALEKAKAVGERRLFYAQEMTERVADKLALENKLRLALANDEFVLHYQPKVDTETRAIVGVEALIRWQSPELGLVPPMKFIPLLEETGLIMQVGSWALNRAALDHRSLFEQGLKPPRIAVNVSSIQLRQRDFVAVVETAILGGVAPTGIDLEITESLIMQDIEANIEKLKNVRGLGIGIAIDDFGTGYSSLAYLAKLPVQTIKIDRSFIITMLKDPDTATLVQTVISLARSLKLSVVAEGVDAEEQARFLRLLRCDQMQGYLFSKPLPLEAMTALLKAGPAAR